jgi:hypothetical protein
MVTNITDIFHEASRYCRHMQTVIDTIYLIKNFPHFIQVKVKNKAISVQVQIDPEGSRMLTLPQFSNGT